MTMKKGQSPADATLFTYLDYRAINGGHGDDISEDPPGILIR
jgi:hypothetical protein